MTTSAEEHANYSRVKSWLWVHEKYRDQAKALLEMDDLAVLKPAFTKFHKKIASHSKFEDTQLFKYFVDAKVGDQEAFASLMEQHKDIRSGDAVKQALEKGEGYMGPLGVYVKDMMEHLEVEENTIVDLWLNLTPEQYKNYRTYLSWKYCFMY